ncbi:MAG TPA: dual specificity protein phosphatase family protein [Verrucomicrobiae bacterium]|jgi:protein-tyrosine phosphatase
MARSFLLLLLGIGLGCIAVVYQGWTYLIGWLGLDFVILGVAHMRRSHRVFGKRADGCLPLWTWAMFLPLQIYSLVTLNLTRLIGNEPWISTVNEKLSVGSRPRGADNCAAFDTVVDLTAEFQETKRVRQRAGYFCFPILDASAPSAEALIAALNAMPKGRILIHCAQGHGRTGLFAAAWLLASGAAATANEALSILKIARPGIELNSLQMRCLSEVELRLKQSPK